MEDAPTVTTEDVAQGKADSCAPAPTRRKRRRTGPAGEEPRSWRSPDRDMESRLDATAIAKKIAHKANRKLNDRVGGRRNGEPGDAPIRTGEDWSPDNRGIPAREIAADLFRLSPATVAQYLQGVQENRGSLTSAKSRGGSRKERIGSSNQGVCARRGNALRLPGWENPRRTRDGESQHVGKPSSSGDG